MIVRRLGPGDEQVVERLAEQSPPARVTELLADERTILLAAFEDEGPEPIGFVLAHELVRRHGDPSQLFVYEVGVAPEARRRGVATELLRAPEHGPRPPHPPRVRAHERGERGGDGALPIARGRAPECRRRALDFDYDGG